MKVEIKRPKTKTLQLRLNGGINFKQCLGTELSKKVKGGEAMGQEQEAIECAKNGKIADCIRISAQDPIPWGSLWGCTARNGGCGGMMKQKKKVNEKHVCSGS